MGWGKLGQELLRRSLLIEGYCGQTLLIFRDLICVNPTYKNLVDFKQSPKNAICNKNKDLSFCIRRALLSADSIFRNILEAKLYIFQIKLTHCPICHRICIIFVKRTASFSLPAPGVLRCRTHT